MRIKPSTSGFILVALACAAAPSGVSAQFEAVRQKIEQALLDPRVTDDVKRLPYVLRLDVKLRENVLNGGLIASSRSAPGRARSGYSLAHWGALKKQEAAAVIPAARVDSIFAAYNRTDSPGCAVGVIRNGQLIHPRGYGMANLELGVPITSHTVFDRQLSLRRSSRSILASTGARSWAPHTASSWSMASSATASEDRQLLRSVPPVPMRSASA